jgi:phosphopantothenate-cysteine ligase/phosphopantothenoylcysteine decarboxylase/phosphopantothenate--cysteine ligase
MKILVTAGATMVMIDQVRAITNIFKGQTGTEIAYHLAHEDGHDVTLVASDQGVVDRVEKPWRDEDSWNGPYCFTAPKYPTVIYYQTFGELASIMEREIRTGNYDVVIHSAAVSDYKVDYIETATPFGEGSVKRENKISSGYDNLILRLVPTFKIVDKIRSEWGFTGKLVKFKLQVGISEAELVRIAMKSREDSNADFIVANCLEWANQYALVVGRDNIVERVTRQALLEAIERRLS